MASHNLQQDLIQSRKLKKNHDQCTNQYMWWRTTHLVPNSTLTTLIGIMSMSWQRYMLHSIRTLAENNCHLSYYLSKIFPLNHICPEKLPSCRVLLILMFREEVSPHFWQLSMLKACLSGVGTPNFGESKQIRLTLAKWPHIQKGCSWETFGGI